jgi:methyl-accepting chemotaxis protein
MCGNGVLGLGHGKRAGGADQDGEEDLEVVCGLHAGGDFSRLKYRVDATWNIATQISVLVVLLGACFKLASMLTEVKSAVDGISKEVDEVKKDVGEVKKDLKENTRQTGDSRESIIELNGRLNAMAATALATENRRQSVRNMPRARAR